MSPSRKWGSSRLTSTSEPKRSVPPDLGCGGAPAAAVAGVALALDADETVAVVAGALAAQDATTTVPRPEATNPSALRRLSLTVSLLLDIMQRAFLDLHASDVCDMLIRRCVWHECRS